MNALKYKNSPESLIIYRFTGKDPHRNFYDSATDSMDFTAFDEYCQRKFPDYKNMSLAKFLKSKNMVVYEAVLTVFQLRKSPYTLTQEKVDFLKSHKHLYNLERSRWSLLGVETVDGMFSVDCISLDRHTFYHVYDYTKGKNMTLSDSIKYLGRINWKRDLEFYREFKDKHKSMAEHSIKLVFPDWDGNLKSLPKYAYIDKILHWSHGIVYNFKDGVFTTQTAKDYTRSKVMADGSWRVVKPIVTQEEEGVYCMLYDYLQK